MAGLAARPHSERGCRSMVAVAEEAARLQAQPVRVAVAAELQAQG